MSRNVRRSRSRRTEKTAHPGEKIPRARESGRQDPTRLRIFGDGSQSTSYIHVDDILNAVLLAGKHCTARSEVFNVATGAYISVKESADLAADVCGLPAGSVKHEFTGGDRGWKGDVPVVRFDYTRISSLGWKCSVIPLRQCARR